MHHKWAKTISFPVYLVITNCSYSNRWQGDKCFFFVPVGCLPGKVAMSMSRSFANIHLLINAVIFNLWCGVPQMVCMCAMEVWGKNQLLIRPTGRWEPPSAPWCAFSMVQKRMVCLEHLTTLSVSWKKNWKSFIRSYWISFKGIVCERWTYQCKGVCTLWSISWVIRNGNLMAHLQCKPQLGQLSQLPIKKSQEL